MRGALDRALFTVIGAVAAIVVLTIGHELITRGSRKPLSPVADVDGGRTNVGPE